MCMMEKHNGISGVYSDINKTVDKIRKIKYWLYLCRNIEEWYWACTLCAIRRELTQMLLDDADDENRYNMVIGG